MFEKLKILYLEDEPLVALDTGEFLQTLGFETVEIAFRLDQANQLVRELQFDLALLDINVDGGQTSLKLGALLAERGTKVIFASGNSSFAKQLEERGQQFLDKPFSHPELCDRLEDVDALTALAEFNPDHLAEFSI